MRPGGLLPFHDARHASSGNVVDAEADRSGLREGVMERGAPRERVRFVPERSRCRGRPAAHAEAIEWLDDGRGIVARDVAQVDRLVNLSRKARVPEAGRDEDPQRLPFMEGRDAEAV